MYIEMLMDEEKAMSLINTDHGKVKRYFIAYQHFNVIYMSYLFQNISIANGLYVIHIQIRPCSKRYLQRIIIKRTLSSCMQRNNQRKRIHKTKAT